MFILCNMKSVILTDLSTLNSFIDYDRTVHHLLTIKPKSVDDRQLWWTTYKIWRLKICFSFFHQHIDVSEDAGGWGWVEGVWQSKLSHGPNCRRLHLTSADQFVARNLGTPTVQIVAKSCFLVFFHFMFLHLHEIVEGSYFHCSLSFAKRLRIALV